MNYTHITSRRFNKFTIIGHEQCAWISYTSSIFQLSLTKSVPSLYCVIQRVAPLNERDCVVKTSGVINNKFWWLFLFIAIFGNGCALRLGRQSGGYNHLEAVHVLNAGAADLYIDIVSFLSYNKNKCRRTFADNSSIYIKSIIC